MVQVDVVWSYAFGASFAAAAAHQLKKAEHPFTTKYFIFTLLFLSLLFVPSGVYLLWEHTQWETMQVATSKDDLPSWLVTVFVFTNVTQGILGYWISYMLTKKNKIYYSHLNWIIAWIIFWFILICGWDCTDWQRFLYDMSVNNGALWQPSKYMGISFFYDSRVWWALVVMALFFAPMLLYGYIHFTKEGYKEIGQSHQAPHTNTIIAIIFGMQWVICLALAIVASLIVIQLYNAIGSLILAYIMGIILFAICSYYILFRRNMVIYKIIKPLFITE